MAFEANTQATHTALYDRVRAALKDATFMGYDLVLSAGTGTFQLGETVTSGGKSGKVRAIGTSYLLIDTIAGGAPAVGNVYTGGTSGATGTVGTATSRAWTEIYADAPGGGAGNNWVDKRCILKNTGDAGTDEIWITLQQVTDTSGGGGSSTVAGIAIDGARFYDGLVGGWAGLLSIAGAGGGVGSLIPMAATGNATRDAVKYWLVADRKRVILAVQTEYQLGGGQIMWGYTGYLTRWDAPSQYPQPHLVTAPGYGLYTSARHSFPYHDIGSPARTIIGVTDPTSTANPDPLNGEPRIAHPDGTPVLVPVWLHDGDTHLGEVDGLFYLPPTVAQGDTIAIGGVNYVALQDYVPGHYAALKLW